VSPAPPLARAELPYLFCRQAVRIAFKLWFAYRAEGLENLPTDRSYLLVANHHSFIDPPMVGCADPHQLGYLARKSLFKPYGFGRLLRFVGSIPVDRGSSDRGALEAAVRCLRSGRPIVFFPEGTRGPEGEVGPFKRGFLLVARRAGVPVVPVGITGSGRAWPKGRVLPRMRAVTVRFGTPIPPGELRVLGEEGVRRRVLSLCET